MRIRLPFAVVFVAELFFAAALGLFPQPDLPINDKLAHFLVFFIMTFTFYFLIDTTRRRQTQLTMSTLLPLAVLSEIVQALLPNDRTFDLFDILANLLGAATSLGLCNLYHKRMLERRRKSKGYALVRTGEEADDEDESGPLGGVEEQELGVVDLEATAGRSNGKTVPPIEAGSKTMEQELDTWDEHADDDWDEDDGQPGPEVIQTNDAIASGPVVTANGPNEDSKEGESTQRAV